MKELTTGYREKLRNTCSAVPSTLQKNYHKYQKMYTGFWDWIEAQNGNSTSESQNQVLNFQIKGQNQERDKLLLRYISVLSATKQNVHIDISLKLRGREIAHHFTFIESLLWTKHCSDMHYLTVSHHEKGTSIAHFLERGGNCSTIRLSDFHKKKIIDTDSKWHRW